MKPWHATGISTEPKHLPDRIKAGGQTPQPQNQVCLKHLTVEYNISLWNQDESTNICLWNCDIIPQNHDVSEKHFLWNWICIQSPRNVVEL